MSSAARDPLPADKLPHLLSLRAMVHEAPPDPPRGPIRDALADDGAARVDRATALMDGVVDAYNARVAGVVEARMRGPRARKGTRFWSPDQVKTYQGGGVATLTGERSGIEVKALDAEYVLPDKMVGEIGDAVRPVGLRIVSDAAGQVARSLGRPNTGLAAFDWSVIQDAVDSAVAEMLGVARRHARDVRREILHADSTAESLDQAITNVLEATRRGGNWLKVYGRTLATALTGDAALGAARALGVTHASWLSRRDDRVRLAHGVADGQQRPIGESFLVGGFRLRFPGDPAVLPEGIGMIAGCRCSLIFNRPVPNQRKAVRLAQEGTPVAARALLAEQRTGVWTNADIATGTSMLIPSQSAPASVLDSAAPLDALDPAGLATGGIGVPVVFAPAPVGSPLVVPEVTAPADVVGYRTLDWEVPVEPGQRLAWPGPLTLALAPPAVAGLGVLAVVIPAGMAVGVSNGTVILPADAALSVASVTQGQIVAQPVPLDQQPPPG